MQEKYPFLSLWKKDGLKRFPPVPFISLVDHFYSELLEPVIAPTEDKEPYLDDDFEIRLRPKFNVIKRAVMETDPSLLSHIREQIIEDHKWKNSLRIDITGLIIEATQEALTADYFKWGKIVREARKSILNGADREKVLRELGKKVLPLKRGGASLLSGIQLRTLKNVYLEMQEAIKEARRTMSLNVNHPDEQGVRIEEWGGFIKGCPWADTVFEEAEFKDILSEKSPADVAAKIIVQRLGRALKTNLTSGRSLQNILQNVLPIVRQN